MESVEKLRRYIEKAKSGISPICEKNILAIADEIEREHEDELLSYSRLPVDADGVPIRVGDELEPTGECGMRVTVNSIQFTDDGCWVFAGAMGRRPHKYRHVKPDSWERIIEDATALGAQMGRRTVQVDDFVARCKALAGEE